MGGQQVGADGAVSTTVADHGDAPPAGQGRADERVHGIGERPG